MKTLIKICLYLLGLVLLLTGVLTILLEEPIYGAGLLLMGLLTLPFTSRFLTNLLPKLSKPLKLGIVAITGLLIITSISLFGREEYDQVESLSPETIAGLSQHNIKQEKINGLDYYYIEKGKGDPIILLHGFPDMANTWDETIEALSKNHRVIAPFLRGYYPTGMPENMDFSVKTIAGDIVELANALSIEQFTIAGQDWGASISFAVTNLVPDRINKVVSIAIPHPTCLKPTPALLYAARHFLLFGTRDYGLRYTRKNDFEYIDRLYQRWSPDYTDYKTSSNAIKETFKYPGRLEATLAYYWSFGDDQNDPEKIKFYEILPKVPVLFMVGEHDEIATKEIMNAMESGMPKGSKAIVFKNAGHFLHREIFDEYIKVLEDFL